MITDNLKNFRHLNIDHLIVGWYQSSLFGSFVNKSFIEDQFIYQSDIEDSIVLVYGNLINKNVEFFSFHKCPSVLENIL